MNGVIEAVRGMRDVLPNEHNQTVQVQALLQQLLLSHGYAFLDLPIVEHRDLYLRKMGEELVGKVYEFTFGGRDLALRPEWTASVLRAYVSSMQDQPLPLRLAYTGPVFRYQRPQRLTYRQFTHTGVEVIGGTVPRADAEVVALACAGLDAVGVQDYRIVIGHIGLIRDVLNQIGLAERTQGWLIWNLERMRTKGIESIRTQLHTLIGEVPIDPSLITDLEDEQVRTLFMGLLQTIGINLSFGSRSPEEIVDRMVRKLRREDPLSRIDQALDLLWQLGQIHGPPDDTLTQIAALLDAANVQTSALDELRTILKLLTCHGVPLDRIELDPGRGRGLYYYTGLIFEIYDTENVQVCGGGRYDDLVHVLGGRQSVPAIGFSYGLERVVAAANLATNQHEQRRDVFVSPVTDDDYPYALEVVHKLRACGFVATTDVRGRTVSNNLRDATRRGVRYMAIVGSDEQSCQEVVWRDLDTRQEQRVSIHELGSLYRATS